MEPGERLRSARKALGLSVDVVSKRVGISSSGVRAHENGQNGIRPDVAEVYASVLGVTAAWILYGPDDGDQGVPIPTRGRANYLRAWRHYRKLTRKELAEKVSTSEQVIADLEDQPHPPGGRWLVKLADALSTRPGFLQDFDPDEADAGLLEEILATPKDRQADAANVLRILNKRI